MQDADNSTSEPGNDDTKRYRTDVEAVSIDDVPIAACVFIGDRPTPTTSLCLTWGFSPLACLATKGSY